MHLARSFRAILQTSGSEPIDWTAVERACIAATDPGSVALTSADRSGYRSDIQDARTRVRSVTNLSFSVPSSVEVQNRHHWIEANIDTFRRVMAPLSEEAGDRFPGPAQSLNTGAVSLTLSVLARHVLGQYDPLLLAEEPGHSLYFVHPNIRSIARELSVDYPRFRRWIVFHEVTHAAEFGAAPWLVSHLESQLVSGLAALSRGSFDRDAFRELDTTMTAVEGYAELLMDEAFDRDAGDLRRKLDARRQQRGPIGLILNRLLGLGLKRRQYERGRSFFEAVADARGLDAAGTVWAGPDSLPSDEELTDPNRWIERVDP